MCPYVTLSTLLLHSCCCCCLFPAPRTGSWGSQNPFPMANQALLFLPCLLLPLQRDTHSFAVGACHLHAGAQLPRDAASGARGGCARSSWLPGFYSSSFCLLLLENNNPQFCSRAGRCKPPCAGGGPSGPGTPFLPWGRHREKMNVFKAKRRLSSWSGSQPQNLVKKPLNQLNPLCRMVGRCLLHLLGVRNTTQNSLDVEFSIHFS